MRTDAKKNIDKIAWSLAKNPLQTVREVEKDTGVSKSTVAKHIDKVDKLGQKDDRIISLTDKDYELMKMYQMEKETRITTASGDINNNDLDKWENTATRRYSLFRWEATDEWGWAKVYNLVDDTK